MSLKPKRVFNLLFPCPTCDGAKIVGGFRCTEDGCSPFQETCKRCNGLGHVSKEVWERVKIGHLKREDRISRDMSLREEAKRLGISAIELSKIERGE